MRVVEALDRLDIPLASYRVETRLTSEEALRLRDVKVHGWVEAGSLRIGRVGGSEPGFGVVFRFVVFFRAPMGVSYAYHVRAFSCAAARLDGDVYPPNVPNEGSNGKNPSSSSMLLIVIGWAVL